MKRWLAAAAVLVVLTAGAASLLYQRALSPVSSEATPVAFTVPAGASFQSIARALAAKGLIRNARAVALYARREGLDHQLRAGEYVLAPNLGAAEIVRRLTAGEVRTHAVSIPEGLRLEEIAARLAEAELVERDAFLEVVRDPATADAFGVDGETLEGYLFPETYRLAKGLTPKEVARAMVAEFLKVWDEIEEPAAARGFGMRETVTLASIVEKETGAVEERPLIAGVFWNRLGRGMRLETDPTVIYGIEDFDGNLRRLHLEDASNPYNTYQIPGLPPGPIASPGEAALRAVVAPEETDHLFFVARGNGTHHFSVTYQEHARAVEKYQLRRRRR